MVADSGTFTTAVAATTLINPTGLIDITGGTFRARSAVDVRGTLRRPAGGTFTWDSANTMYVQQGGDVDFTGAYALPHSSVVNVLDAGSLLRTTSTLDRRQRLPAHHNKRRRRLLGCVGRRHQFVGRERRRQRRRLDPHHGR